jgi:DNA-binding transcriptional ArsR family regulator
VDDVAAAIADPVRRSILEMLRDDRLPAGRIADRFEISRPAISRHLRVLRQHGLIEEQPLDGDRRGRVYRLRAGSLDPLAGWLDEIRRFWAGHLEQFRAFVEAEHAGEEP